MNKMKILVIGDTHFKEGNSNSTNIMYRSIESMLDDDSFDLIVLLGDIYHDHNIMRVGVNRRVCDFILMLCSHVRVFILVGNHDIRNNSCYLPEEHTLYHLKHINSNVRIIDRPVTENILGHNFTFCPYVPVGRFMEALSTTSWKDSKLIFCHQEIRGVVINKISSISGDQWNPKYPTLVCGHIHSRQELDNVHYVGTPYSQDFSDIGTKSISIYEIQGDSINLTYRELGVPSHLRFECEAPKFIELINSIVQPPGSKIRINVRGTKSQLDKLNIRKHVKSMRKNDIDLIVNKIQTDKINPGVSNLERTGSFADYLKSYLIKNGKNHLSELLDSLD